MSAAKHTPSPWFIYDDGDADDSSDIIRARIDGDNYDIAAMSDELPIAERKANAELIAAAPDLLAACERFEAVLEIVRTEHSKLLKLLAEDHRIISAVIAKAKGQS